MRILLPRDRLQSASFEKIYFFKCLKKKKKKLINDYIDIC